MTKNNNGAIGVFDSGIGGLTVLSEIVRLLPSENYIYYGDGKSCPMGEKSPEEIISITNHAVEELIKLGAKIIVIACNTATSSAITYLRTKYDIDFVAMEPAVKPAVNGSKTRIVGVLATRRTIEGDALKKLCNRWAGTCKVALRAGNGLVEIVEKDGEITIDDRKIITDHITDLIDQNVDHIVLGCTHYPFLKREIEQIIGTRQITIVDPAPFVANRVLTVLKTTNLINPNGTGSISFISSLDSSYNTFIEKSYLKLLSL